MKPLVAKLFSSLLITLLLAGTSMAADTTANFTVTGMMCSACQVKIESALSKTDGVKAAQVDLKAGSATVTYDDGKVKPDQIIKIIENEGFKAQLKKKS